MVGRAKWGWLSLACVLLACGSDDDKPNNDRDSGTDEEDAGDGSTDDWKPLDYGDDDHWLCKPGFDDNPCEKIDLTTAERQAGDTYKSIETEIAKDPKADCFYVYPSTDTNETPGTVEELSDADRVLLRVRNQAGRFASLCRIFLPLYREMTVGTYKAEGGYAASEYFDHAYRDVEAAFDHYLENDNKGRPFVLLGHSQGTHTLIRLVQDRIEKDNALRAQMAGAMLIGPVGAIQVPKGKRVGGTFKKVPLCAEGEDISGCVVAFDSKAGRTDSSERNPATPIADGMERACVIPSTLAGGTDNVLAVSIWERDSGIPFLPDSVTDPYVSFPRSTTATCEEDGYMGLDGWADSETPVTISPQILQSALEGMDAKNALHSVDYNYSMGDLLRIVAAQIDAI